MASTMMIGTRSVAERVAHELAVSRSLTVLAAMEDAATRVGYRFVKSRQPHELPPLVIEAMAECAGLDTELVLSVLRDLGIRLHPAKDAAHRLQEEAVSRNRVVAWRQLRARRLSRRAAVAGLVLPCRQSVSTRDDAERGIRKRDRN